MYNGHRSDRQWSRLERQLSLPSASPQSATLQMVYGSKGHPENFAPVGDVAQVADFDRRRSGGHKQTIDSYQMSSDFQTTVPPGSRNLLVDQRGRYQHCAPSNQPSTLTDAAYVRRNESVEILRHVSSEFTSRRPRSEMYPTTKASVGDASNFTSGGCCSECRGLGDDGYVINGRGPLTMTSAAEATNGRSTMLFDARMVEAVDSLSSASRSDFDDASHRRLQPQSSPASAAHRLSYQCPPDGVSIGTGTSKWRPGEPVEMRRKLKSGDGKFSAACQPVLPRAPRATPASVVGLRSVDNFNTAVRDVTSKSPFKNGFHVVGANDTRGCVLGSNSITSALTTEQHLNHCDVNEVGTLDTSFNDIANDYRNYQNSDWSRWSRDIGPLSEASTSCGFDGSKGGVRFGVSAGDRSPLKPALPSASALRQVAERQSHDSVERQTQRGLHHTDDDFGFHDDWTAVSNGMRHHEATSNVASNLKAHLLSLSHSQSNNIVADPAGNHLRRGQQSVSSVSLSSSASSGSGLQLKRRLKTIVETLDVLTSVGNRKSMLSSSTAAAVTGQQGNTRRIRVKLQRSNSDPEGLDRINNDDAEFGFSGNSIPHLRALQDDCALNRRTGNVLAPSPTTTMSSGSHSADERNRDLTSARASGVSSTSKPSISIKLWGSKKVQTPGGTGRNSEPCSPLDSSAAASCRTAFDRDSYDVTMPIRNPPSSILDLTDEEHTVLQKISMSRLNALGELNGCSVVIPKGGVTEASGGRPISSKFSQLKKYVSSSAAFSDNGKHVVIDSPGKDKSTGGGKGLVFGIPLDKVLANEAAEVNSSTGVDLKSSSSDDNLVDALSLSLNESLSNRYRSTSSLNSLSNHRGASSQQQQQSMVPYVVRTCCQFLQTHGRHVPGIFRVTGAKSRVTMLRQEFDSGRQVRLSEEQHVVHDVASLLKEFIRDLPDPLLTRDLYTAFLATTSIDDVNRRVSVLRLLVSLLPPANRDTLWTLLSFLGVLAKYSDDTVDEKGQLLSGNKMDSSNLATVFGPNLLSKSKTGKLQVDGLEQMSHNAEIVAVTKDLIDFHSAIFRLTKELYNDIIHSTVTRLPSHVTSIGQSQSSCTSSSSVQHDANVTIKIYPPDFSTAPVSMTTRSLASDDSTHSASGVKLNSTTEYDLSERHSLLMLKNNQNSPRHSVAGSDRTSSSSSSFGGLNAPHHVERSSSPVSSSGTAATSESVLNTASHANGDVTRQAIGDWQIQRWRHWERLADQSKRQASEQQTLV